jgi:hypothetical protein
VPRQIGRWEAVGVNERFRNYRDDAAESLDPHDDGSVFRGGGRRP